MTLYIAAREMNRPTSHYRDSGVRVTSCSHNTESFTLPTTHHERYSYWQVCTFKYWQRLFFSRTSSLGMLGSVDWLLVTDVSGQPIGPIFVNFGKYQSRLKRNQK